MPKENNDLWSNLARIHSEQNGGTGLGDTPHVQEYTPTADAGRQILNILFLIDVSGSMRGTRIGQVNYALENIFKELRSREDLISTTKVAVMEFADGAAWRTPQPIALEDYVFTRIQVRPQYTYYGKAFLELEKKLHSSQFMNPALGEYFAPLILFITDGEPVDPEAYPAALETLRRNKWFRKSSKYAIAVGEESRNAETGKLLAQFTQEERNVRYADEGAELCQLIEFITVRGSEVKTSMVEGEMQGSKSSIFAEKDRVLFATMFDE